MFVNVDQLILTVMEYETIICESCRRTTYFNNVSILRFKFTFIGIFCRYKPDCKRKTKVSRISVLSIYLIFNIIVMTVT
jgi:hypothetical protein